MAWKRKSWDPKTDRYWGPFTYNSASRSKRIALELCSPGDESESESGKAGLRITLGKRTLILALPKWVCPPVRYWVPTEQLNMGKHEKPMTVGGYWGQWPRQFGFSLAEAGDQDGYDFLIVYYGQQTHSSNDTKSWSWFLPWKQWRMVRHTFYASGYRVAYEAPCPGPRWDTPAYDLDRQAKDAVPTRIFAFLDYDGEHLYATTRIEEREWHRGDGWWKWVSRFSEPMLRTSLDIRFSGETGKRKGSWKGGTIGTGIDLRVGEGHVGAFMRYCQEHDMRFLFEVDEIPPAMDPTNKLKPCPTELPHLCCWPDCTCAKEREPDKQD